MIALDIETYKDTSDENYVAWKTANISAPSNYKDPVAIERYIQTQRVETVSKFALNPLTGKIILIGLLTDVKPQVDCAEYDTESLGKVYIKMLAGEEEQLIREFWDVFHHNRLNDGGVVVTYNGKQFDLPFILHRSAILNIKPRVKMSIGRMLNKYQHEPHLDLFNWFGGGSLVEWSYRLGLTNSLQRDGGEIGGWYEAGQMELIKQKNSIDLFQTATIYNRIKDWI